MVLDPKQNNEKIIIAVSLVVAYVLFILLHNFVKSA